MPKRKSDEMKRELKIERLSIELSDSDEDIFRDQKPKSEKEEIKDELIGSSDEDKKPKKVKINTIHYIKTFFVVRCNNHHYCKKFRNIAILGQNFLQ